jgi:hypothetical protein
MRFEIELRAFRNSILKRMTTFSNINQVALVERSGTMKKKIPMRLWERPVRFSRTGAEAHQLGARGGFSPRCARHFT